MTIGSDETGLIGRDAELARLDGFVTSVRAGDSQTLVIRGEAGVGKSALLKVLPGRARGCRVDTVSGVESEMELPFACLHLLCAPMLDRLDGLPGPQREALEVAFGIRSGEAPNRFIVGLAALGLFCQVAAEVPLLCLIDDAQWVDTASMQALSVAARRSPAVPLGFVFSVRERGAGRHLDGLTELRLSGLDRAAAEELLRVALPFALDTQVQSRLVAETRGNPLALLELPKAVTPADLASGLGLAASALLANRIEDSFKQRVRALPEESQGLLLVAAAEPVGDAALLWDAAARLGIRTDAAEAAEDADLVQIGRWVRFRHPLVRSAVYRAASATDRRRAHRALAEATDASVDPDRRAWHRARAVSGRDDEVADELERSAGRAQARGGIAAAAAFLERSAELTLDRRTRADRAISAAGAKLEAALPDAALELIALAETCSPDDLQRARLLLLRARLTADRPGARGLAARRLSEAAGRLEEWDPAAAAEAHLEAMIAAIYAGRLGDGALGEVAHAADRRSPREDPPSPADLLLDGLARRYTAGYEAAGPTFRRALQSYLSGPHPLTRTCLATSVVAADLWDADSWSDLAGRQVQLARDGGMMNLLPITLNYLASFRICAGDFAGAEALIHEAGAAAAFDRGVQPSYTDIALAAWTGDAALFETLAAQARSAVEAGGDGTLSTVVDYARAVLANAEGNYEVAFQAARTAVDTDEMPVATWALSELLEAASRSHRFEVEADYDTLLERAVSSGTGWALGTAALGRALMSADPDAGYQEAIDRLARTPMIVQTARARLLYGEWLRRAGRRVECRVQLRAAEDVFLQAGATAFALRARSELAASGYTSRRDSAAPGPLTAQEAQIVDLVRQGCTNVEVADRLFVSTRTVEWHLGNVYRKLGVSSRRDLRALQTVPADH
jgi:DNA-binding CsgD family transcriptional regulator